MVGRVPEGSTGGRRSASVVAPFTPLPSWKKAGEVHASFWGMPSGTPFPSQRGGVWEGAALRGGALGLPGLGWSNAPSLCRRAPGGCRLSRGASRALGRVVGSRRVSLSWESRPLLASPELSLGQRSRCCPDGCVHFRHGRDGGASLGNGRAAGGLGDRLWLSTCGSSQESGPKVQGHWSLLRS